MDKTVCHESGTIDLTEPEISLQQSQLLDMPYQDSRVTDDKEERDGYNARLPDGEVVGRQVRVVVETATTEIPIFTEGNAVL